MMDIITYSKIQTINSDLYNKRSAITLTVINGLNFTTGNTSYKTNNSYYTQYFPVLKGHTYYLKYTKLASESTGVYVRTIFSESIPANNVEGTEIGFKNYVMPNYYSFVYTPKQDGYIGVAAYKNNPVHFEIEATTYELGIESKVNGNKVKLPLIRVGNVNLVDGETTYIDHNYRDTYYIQAQKGYKYSWHVEWESGSAVGPTVRLAFALSIPKNGVPATQIMPEFTVPQKGGDYEYTPPADGYISLSTYRTQASLDSISIYCKQDGVSEQIPEIEENDNIKQGLKNGNIPIFCERETLVQDSNNVVMNQWTIVPHNHARINVVCPKDIVVCFDMMASAYDSTTITTAYAGNGDVVELTENYDLYKAKFAYGGKNGSSYVLTGENLTVETVNDLIEHGEIQISYTDESVIVNNKDIEKITRALIGDGSNAVLSHISDTHGDAIRYMNFMEMSRHIGVLCAINSGDAVSNSRSDGYGYLKSAIRKYPDVQTIFCMGNHDAPTTNSTAYTNFYQMYDEAYNYGGLSSGDTYYYKDYEDYNLRIIVLNIYEERHKGYGCRISEDQIEWFIDSLENTPAGYGVIVVAHSTEKWIEKDNSYAKFYNTSATSDWTNKYPNITGDPVSKIVDAFISGTTISDSYTQTVLTVAGGSEDTTETVSYSADFTNLASGAEFICYINGHKHVDMVGYLESTTNPQLSLNITNGATSHYYADQSDFPRADGKGSVQDAFNLYVIDRTAKAVKVIRIGSNRKYDLEARDYMVIPYD